MRSRDIFIFKLHTQQDAKHANENKIIRLLLLTVGKMANGFVLHFITHICIGDSLKKSRRKLRGILLNTIIFNCLVFESNKATVTKSEHDLSRQAFLLDHIKRLLS